MEIDPNLRSIIEALSCSIHNQHPHIIIQQNERLKIDCCCDEFRLQCFHILMKLINLKP
jgi:hypothetical protein